MGGMLVDGRWVTKGHWETDERGSFKRQQSRFRDWVEPGVRARLPVSDDRYGLYVSYACPWAHRTLLARALKGLERAVPIIVVDSLMDDDGWAFRGDDGQPEPEPNVGAQFLREIYTEADPTYTGRVTVPVLWDRQERTIVNNESRDILRMLDVAFDELATRNVDLAPSDRRDRIEETIDAIYEPINNGVYRCGFASTQKAYDEAYEKLFAALDHWDDVLSKQRYLCGDALTEADICMFTTLIRFDAVYYVHFKCNGKNIADYEHLGGYLRELYQLPGVAPVCRFDHIKNHYYRSHRQLNPSGIVPRGPRLGPWLAQPHGRSHLEGGPPKLLAAS